ncbi:hypothetical protein VSDG_00804 [Cytospora chrysosperma]|uniref:Regulator of chromosome condensation 1/beta-lactamase-inhibitor protein II n=1 Tax=Cytospora chrysosperma TaxID=252740 RepID=A0A423WL66_CYTCH|nr:hypothetical protein VSDG_00804 [Valsa sordida]
MQHSQRRPTGPFHKKAKLILPTQALLLGPGGHLVQHRSLADLLLLGRHHQHQYQHQQSQATARLPGFQQVVAYEAGFAALTPAGDVYTWGDERYAACLGRDVSSSSSPSSSSSSSYPQGSGSGSVSPAGLPAPVAALRDLPTGPVVKVAAGGYLLAALTAGQDLYVWGGHPGRRALLAGVGDEPVPVDIGGRDIADVAVGESHVVVLAAGGEVFVIGNNANGQLGLPDKSVESWTRVGLDLQDGQRAVGVAAGPRNTFIMVQKKTT